MSLCLVLTVVQHTVAVQEEAARDRAAKLVQPTTANGGGAKELDLLRSRVKVS